MSYNILDIRCFASPN